MTTTGGVSNQVKHGVQEVAPGESLVQPFEKFDVSVGDESGNEITLTITKKGGSETLEAVTRIEFWFAATAKGAPDASGNTYTLVTGTAVTAVTANAHYVALSNSSGVLAVKLGVSGAATRHLVLVLPDGQLQNEEFDFAA